MKIFCGPVIVAAGEFEGRIGLYEDDDLVFSTQINLELRFQNCESWRLPTEKDCLEEYPEAREVLDVAMVYFGEYLRSGYCLIPQTYLRSLTIEDLIKRQIELQRYFLHACSETICDLVEENDYLKELEYVNSTLVDRTLARNPIY